MGKWPFEVPDDQFPHFYLDKLQNGDEDDKERAADKLVNMYSNNHFMNRLKAFEGGVALDILHAYNQERKQAGLPDRSLSNLLVGLGHQAYADVLPPHQAAIFFNSRGNGVTNAHLRQQQAAA